MPNTNTKLVDSKTIAALFELTPRRIQQLTKEGIITATKEGNANRYEGQGRGEEKKKYVLEFLASMGFTVDEEAVNAAIEAAVNQLNGGNLPLE